MTKSYFLDTSALIKLYHQEAGTDCVDEIFSKKGNIIIVSELSSVEVYSALARKLRLKEITKEAREEAIKNFERDYRDRFVIDPLDLVVIKRAKSLIEKYGDTKSLRALDTLQLASCVIEKEYKKMVFVCADTRLIEIADLEGIEGVNPAVKDQESITK